MTEPAAPVRCPGRLATFARCRLLPALPGRIARHGYAVFRRLDLRAVRRACARPTLIVTHDLSRSGAPLLVLEIAHALRELGHEVVVLSPVPGPFARDLLDAGFRVIVDPRLETAAYLDDLAADARLAICNTVTTAAVAARLAKAVPTLWYIHEVSLLAAWLDKPWVREAIGDVAALWAGSPMCAAHLSPLRADVAVVPYGIAALEPGGPAARDGPLRIGVFGSIESRKGQDLVVAAAAPLPPEARSAVRITLYGRVLEPDFARSVLGSLDGTPIDYGGELDRAGYVAAMRGVDAVLVSSRDDTLPLVSIDALGLGKMLLLVPSVGTTEWLTDGVDALIAEETSVEAIRDLIVRAVAERASAEAIGAAARRAFATHFSPDAFRGRLRATVAELEARR